MNKRLSIIIPTYNMELLLPACLDSLVRSAASAWLDVVVVNDGSRDSSLAIASSYAERYADIVRVIDKPNGNYGSTINAALPTLRGEYVKILDADDTFDCSLLASYVDYLAQVSGADMVVAPFVEIDHKGEHRVDYNIYSRKIYGYGVPYDAERIFSDCEIAYFMMHSVAYRTALLQEIGYRQSEGISYTDQQWCFFPIFNVKTIAFTDIPLYRYNLTREGQTMDSAVQLRSLSQMWAVVKSMAEYLNANGADISKARHQFLLGVVMRRMQGILRKYLLEMTESQFSAAEFDALVAEMKQLAPQPLTVIINGRFRIELLGYWERHHKRLPTTIRHLLLWIDRAMQRVYRVIFNRK